MKCISCKKKNVSVRMRRGKGESDWMTCPRCGARRFNDGRKVLD